MSVEERYPKNLPIPDRRRTRSGIFRLTLSTPHPTPHRPGHKCEQQQQQHARARGGRYVNNTDELSSAHRACACCNRRIIVGGGGHPGRWRVGTGGRRTERTARTRRALLTYIEGYFGARDSVPPPPPTKRRGRNNERRNVVFVRWPRRATTIRFREIILRRCEVSRATPFSVRPARRFSFFFRNRNGRRAFFSST